MKHVAKILVCVCLMLLPAVSFAYYAVGYDVKIHPAHQVSLFGRQPLKPRYSAVVILADYYSLDIGAVTGLQGILSENYHSDAARFAEWYLMVPFQHYLNQIRNNTRIYGAKAEVIAKGLEETESILDGRSSLVLMFEHGDFTNPVSMLRVSAPDENGLLPSEAHFKDHGLVLPPLQPPERYGWGVVPAFNSVFNRDDFIRLETANFKHKWYWGGKLELKNFTMGQDDVQVFFPYMYRIARLHRLFKQTNMPIPKQFVNWPEGFPISAADRKKFSMLASTLQVDAYTPLLERYYQLAGFKSVAPPLNNEHTHGLDLFFMRQTPNSFDAAMNRIFHQRFPELFTDDVDWLVYNRAISQAFRHNVSCIEQIDAVGKVMAKKGKR